MGKINQGILGPVSGQIGNVIGGTWKGIDYLRIAPASVANPNTEAQLNVRSKFATVMHFLQPLTQFVRIGFRNQAIEMTGFNAAMSYNFRNAVSGDYPNYAIDYPNALLAKGTLAPALNPSVTSTVAGSVVFTWQDNSSELNASPIDKTMVVVYNPLKNEAVCQYQQTERADLTQTVTVPASFSGDQVQTFIAFITTDGQLLSNSKYAGVITVA